MRNKRREDVSKMQSYLEEDRHSAEYNWLVQSKSPYLKQHETNPVNWLEWSPEAFEKAKRENKPVFVSIGYSTCHWCHVMERESFEDEEVANLLNKYFVSIKVDREERPDIDSIYMNVCHILTGHGGWPLNVFLTPDQKPFYVGTYFPKYSQYGRPGMMDVITQLHDKYTKENENIVQIADKITHTLNVQAAIDKEKSIPEKKIHEAYEQISKQFDTVYGGFGQAPKFPMPHQLMFLLRYYVWANKEQALLMVENTLQGMANGGIYDHIGGGFSRYATDDKWLVPHFEKMLYDNTLMLYLLAETYQVTKEQRWKKLSYEVVRFIEREMTSPNGAFFSAIDADSEGVEGKYYVWSKEEVLQTLGPELGELFSRAYNITSNGNFEGKNIPNFIHTSLEKIASEINISIDLLEEKLAAGKDRLLQARNKRTYPHVDDKILTAWNALMVAALTKAGVVFQQESFIQRAEKAITFIEDELWKQETVYARYREGEAKYIGYLDDYAFLLWAYVELYEAKGELIYLQRCEKISNILFNRFWDKENGGFFFTDDDGEKLIMREKQSFDDAMPSGNNVAALQLWRLAKITGDQQLMKKVDHLISAFQREVEAHPSGLVYLMQAVMAKYHGGKEVFVSGKSEEKRKEIKKVYHSSFRPFDVFIDVDPAKMNAQAYEAWRDKLNNEDEIALYICEQYACKEPIFSLEQALSHL